MRVLGADNLPEPPYVILSLHQSSFETITLQAVFPPFVWVMKKSLIAFPVIGWMLRLLKPVAIDRGDGPGALRRILRDGRARLDDGLNILIFPEGTRREPGAPGPFSASGVMLARKAGVAIVPVVHNAGRFHAPYSMSIAPGAVTVRIGKAIRPETVRDMTTARLQAMVDTALHAPPEAAGHRHGLTDPS